jgi:hypothetical protein
MTKIEFFYSETNKHIRNVQLLMHQIIGDLLWKARLHDVSKFDDEEKDLFAEVTPELGKHFYGSEEYKNCLAKIKPAIDHHNLHNEHHPENHVKGVTGMTLLDLIEMICDWTAASKRNPNGDVIDSIEKNQSRFGYSDDIKQILINTAHRLQSSTQLFETHHRYVEE